MIASPESRLHGVTNMELLEFAFGLFFLGAPRWTIVLPLVISIALGASLLSRAKPKGQETQSAPKS